MKPTVNVPFIQPAVAVQHHASCVVEQQRRDRRWGVFAATCTSILRAATFTLKTDGSVSVEYSSGNHVFTEEVKPTDVESWWSTKETSNGRPFLTRKHTKGACLKALLVRVRGVTIDLFNTAVEGFKLHGSRQLTGQLEDIDAPGEEVSVKNVVNLEDWARVIVSSSNSLGATLCFRTYLAVDDVLDLQALVLVGNVWQVKKSHAVEFVAWNVGSPNRDRGLQNAVAIPANCPLFRRVASEVLLELRDSNISRGSYTQRFSQKEIESDLPIPITDLGQDWFQKSGIDVPNLEARGWTTSNGPLMRGQPLRFRTKDVVPESHAARLPVNAWPLDNLIRLPKQKQTDSWWRCTPRKRKPDWLAAIAASYPQVVPDLLAVIAASRSPVRIVMSFPEVDAGTEALYPSFLPDWEDFRKSKSPSVFCSYVAEDDEPRFEGKVAWAVGRIPLLPGRSAMNSRAVEASTTFATRPKPVADMPRMTMPEGMRVARGPSSIISDIIDYKRNAKICPQVSPSAESWEKLWARVEHSCWSVSFTKQFGRS